MDDLLEYLVCTIFKIPIYSDETNILKKLKNYNDIFGVFVSIKRQNKIHGCIGYWDNFYNALKDYTILEKLKQVAIDSAYKNTNFSEPLEWDPSAILTIYLMKKPLSDVKPSKIFNNTKYGLIVSDFVNRATFLPGVFGKTKWSFISRELLQKAGITASDYKFKTYEANIYNIKINKILNKKYYTFIWHKIANCFNTNSKLLFMSDPIRNLATIHDLSTINNKLPYLSKQVLTNIKNSVSYYENKLDSQALTSFYMRQTNKCLDIDLNNIDRDFALGQALIALKTVCNEDISSYIKQMHDELLKRSITKDIIFRLNWQMQAIYANSPKITKYSDLIRDYIIKYISKFKSELNNMETNYLVVCFECLCFLQKLYSPEISNLLFTIFIFMNRHFINGLYLFIDKSSRADITGHVVNGLTLLL